MKLGFVSAILPELSFEELVDYATDCGYKCIPGLGDIDWGKFISSLNDIRYEGPVCVEVEDKTFEGSLENRKYSLILCKRFLDQYL